MASKTTKTHNYHCKHCGKTVQRESAKQWIKSICGATGKTVHLLKVVSDHEQIV